MSPSASVDERVCFVGQYHESGDVLRKVALALQAENRELWFLPHPKDVPSKRKWTVPENCHELTKEQGMSAKLGATAAPLVVTEYSNLLQPRSCRSGCCMCSRTRLRARSCTSQ